MVVYRECLFNKLKYRCVALIESEYIGLRIPWGFISKLEIQSLFIFLLYSRHCKVFSRCLQLENFHCVISKDFLWIIKSFTLFYIEIAILFVRLICQLQLSVYCPIIQQE